MSQMDWVLGRIAKRCEAKLKRQILNDFSTAASYTNNEMFEEAQNMYESFIDQFYKFHTSSYIRHGEKRPGTEMGSNLYRGQQIEKAGSPTNPKLIIDFSGEDMDSDDPYSVNRGDADMVLDLVMHGVRFPIKHEAADILTWSGSYKGKYISVQGTPADAFRFFNYRFHDIAAQAFYKKWHELGW